jgi:hypothetical protein
MQLLVQWYEFFKIYNILVLANFVLGGRPGGRIHGHWPGSAAHLNFVRRSPRWEDFEYELLEGNRSKNRFSYWGNGRTTKEMDPDSDLTPYLKLPEGVDLRDWHESWWDL